MAIKRHRKLVDTVGVSENPPTANYQRRPALAQEAKAAQPFRPISHRANPGGARSRRSIESGDTDRRAPFEKTLSFSTLRKVSCSQIRTNRFQPPRHRNSELDRQKQLTHLLPPVKLDCLKQSSLYAAGCVEARERDRPRLVSVANRNGISCAGGRERPPIHRTCVWKLNRCFLVATPRVPPKIFTGGSCAPVLRATLYHSKLPYFLLLGLCLHFCHVGRKIIFCPTSGVVD